MDIPLSLSPPLPLFLKKKSTLTLSSTLYSIQAPTDRMMPTRISKCDFLLLIQMLISSINALTYTPRNNVLPAILASLSPVKLIYKINYIG